MKQSIIERPIQRAKDKHGKFISFKKFHPLSQWIAIQLSRNFVLTIEQMMKLYKKEFNKDIPKQTLRDALMRLRVLGIIGKRDLVDDWFGRNEIAFFLKYKIWEVFVE